MEWIPVGLPDDKAGIEREIVRFFGWEWSKQGVFLIWHQNDENDFDFDLWTRGGRVHLDLVEVIYWKEQRRPYENNTEEVCVGNYADQIVQLIEKKSRHYSPNTKSPIRLLCYITHWAFITTEAVLYLVRKALRERPLVFETVFLLSASSANDVDLRVLFPSDAAEAVGKEAALESCRESVYYNANPANFELSHRDGKTTITWKTEVDLSKMR